MKGKKKAMERLQMRLTQKQQEKKPNPFNVHINRRKHQVLGHNLKSEIGFPGVSKSKAWKKRNETLLQEYLMRGKNNHFIDRRIGERNPNMTEDDKVMARFTAARMRMFNKKAKFNLSDTEVLTHRGQPISEIEKFEETRSDDDDEDEQQGKSGILKGKFVESHFGGGMLTKSKQDRESLINELINESKKRKAERQRAKEETLDATQQLDKEWTTLGMIVTATKDTTEVPNTQNKDKYDLVMRQLKFEPNAQASERLKTEDEIAKEDREQLERLEKERLKQLREIEANKYNHKSADDLDDGCSYLIGNFTEEDVSKKEASDESSSSDVDNDDNEGGEKDDDINEVDEKDNEDEIEEEDEVEEGDDNESSSNSEEEGEDEKDSIPPKKCKIANKNNKSVHGTEKCKKSEENIKDKSAEELFSESEDEDCAMDDLDDLMPTSDTFDQTTCSKYVEVTKGDDMETTSPYHPLVEPVELDLPYVLDVPESYDSFKNLLANRSIDHVNKIFERLVKSNHPRLDPTNKKKVLKLAEYIIEIVSKGDVSWKELAVMASQFSILKEFNKEECLRMLVDSLATKVDELDNTPSEILYEEPDLIPPSINQIKFLFWYIMMFLKPQGMDVLVPINRPALSLASQVVSDSFTKKSRHITVGLLFCYLLLQDAKSSSTLYTEAIAFLQKCIEDCISRAPRNNESADKKKKKSKSETKQQDLRIHLADIGDHLTNPDDDKVLFCSVCLLSGFVKAYRKYPASKLLFKEIGNIVLNIETSVYPSELKQEINNLQTLLKVLQSAKIEAVVKAAKKPKALRQYEPSFHTVTVGKSVRGLPAERQEQLRLLHKYKHEKKGAMRELRRDRVFLANVKYKQKKASDEQRMRKVKEIYGSAAAQQGELRSLKRKK